MPGITMLLPQPPTTVTAVTLYGLVGIAVCSLVSLPLPQRCAHPRGDHFGTEPVRARLRAHAHATRNALRTVMRSDDESMKLPVYLEQNASFSGEPTRCETADWTQVAAARVVEALEQRRLLDAAWAARSLAWDVEFAFGPNSSQLWRATELLAHVCHEIGDDVRATQLYARAATGWARNFGAEYPDARAAYERAVALWAQAHAAGAADPATDLLMASIARLFAQAGAAA